MPLRLNDKEAIVEEVNRALGEAMSMVVADSCGVDVTTMTAFRKRAREAGVSLKVVRNTLTRRAIQGTRFECIGEALAGPTLLAFSQMEPGPVARLCKEFAQENDNFEIRALALDGKLLPATALDQVAALPTREEALAQLLGLLKAPVRNFVCVLNAVPTKLVRTLAAIGQQKDAP